jgi:phosphatidylglycerol:prolipoprotein diacylglycerol transferase
MRPRLVQYIDNYFNISFATYLVPTGTTMYVLAMLSVMYVYVKRCEHTRLSAYHALGTCIYAMIGGLAGARIFYLLETFRETLADPAVILNLFGGTTSWGVYIGGLAGYFLYLRLNKLAILSYADVLGASLGLGPFIGRGSCFLHGCCYGTLSDLPWAIQYPASSPLYWHQVKQGILPAQVSLSTAVHPLPAYLSLSALVVFICTSILWHKYRNRPGMTFLSYWLLYCSLRFIWEYFRGNAVRWGSLQLDLGQILCVLIVLTAGFLLLRFYTNFAMPRPNL